MVTVDQRPIKDIPPTAVPGDKKWCEIHQRPYEVYYTRRKNDEVNRRLEVRRVYWCPCCGKDSRYVDNKSKVFKKVPAAGTISDKM